MGVRYPGPVSRHNLVGPYLDDKRFCPRLGPFLFCHDGGRFATTVAVLPRRWPLVPLVGTGLPRTYPSGKFVGVAGRVSWQ